MQAGDSGVNLRALGVVVGILVLVGVGTAYVLRKPGRPEPDTAADLGTRVAAAPRGLLVRDDATLAETADAVGTSRATGTITVDYPHDESVFPPEFVPPTFLWHDETASDAWLVAVAFADGEAPLRLLVPGPPPPKGEIDTEALGPTNDVYRLTPYQASARSWTPSDDVWEEIKRRSIESPAIVTLRGFAAHAPAEALAAGRVTITTSEDPVGAPIFYRDVPLMPAVSEESGVIQPLAQDALPLIGWRLKDVSRPDSRLVLTGMPSCANCHSFSQDGSTLGMDVDGPQGDKGTYAVVPVSKDVEIGHDQVITWNDFPDKPKGHKTIGFLSRISPKGKFALTTVNEDVYVANFANYRFLQVFYPTRGILASYSTETEEMKALPGADDPTYVHCNPVWTPDGKTIVFCRAEAFDSLGSGNPLATEPNDPNEPRILYDLYRMPFNGGAGGTPEAVAGASQNGMSNTFPKVSPDGKWIVYTKCRNGLLMRPDGKLWIVPTEGGEAREMRCNTSLMNSWHSFSPNGRWLVFSSKVNRPYTQMFLTHVDEEGNDTPPVLIPDATADNRAVNIPEFANVPYDALHAIDVPAVNHHRFFADGVNLVTQGRYEEAKQKLERALEEDPDFTRAHLYLGFTLGQMREFDRATRHYERAAQLDPQSPSAHHGLGSVQAGQGRNAAAAVHFEKAIALDPYHYPSWANLGIARLQTGRPDEAVVALSRALRLSPRDATVHRFLSEALIRIGRVAEGVKHLDHAAALNPSDHRSRSLLAWYLATLEDAQLRDGKRAVALALQACEGTRYERPEPLDALAAAYAETGDFKGAVETAKRALGIAQAVNPALAEHIAKRIGLYRAGIAARDTPGRAGPR